MTQSLSLSVLSAEERSMSKNNTITILDTSLSGGFTATPNVVLRNPKVSPQAKTVYSLLLSYAWFNAQCFPGQEKLAQDLGVHTSSVKRYLKELKKHQLITWKQRGLNKTNEYFILPLTRLDRPPMVYQDRPQSVDKEYEEEKDKVNNGFSDEKPKPLKEYIKSLGGNSQTTPFQKALNHYLLRFQRKTGLVHPSLKQTQWLKIVENLMVFQKQWGLEVEDWCDMVDEFFDSRLETDYNLNHFATTGILDNRFWTRLYG